MSELLTSVTAPGVVFESKEAFLEHYRSDWHRYNLRRKVAGLAMATKEDYEAKVLAQREAEEDDKEEKKESHLKADKKKRNKKKKKKSAFEEVGGAALSDPVASFHSKKRVVVVEEEEDDDEEEEEEEGNEEEKGEEVVTASASACDSLFDAKKFEDVSTALNYMRETYSFFLPEVQYLVDAEKCVFYLSEKVKVHRVCLYCNRQFRSFRACQQHMIDKSHCKVAYDDDEDLAELADFYDFSASYDDYADMDDDELGLTKDDDDDDDDWVDVDSEEEEEEGFSEEEERGKIFESKSSTKKSSPRVTVLDSGELLIRKDGKEKVVGVRWLKRYYKQNFRLDDDRAATTAVRGEQTTRLVALYEDAGLALKREENFFARGLALQVNKRALNGVIRRDQRQQIRHAQMNQGMHSGRAKRHNGNMAIKNRVAGKNQGEGVGVHG